MRTRKFTQRHFLAGIAASTALAARPYVRGSYPASKLTAGFRDHWLPRALCRPIMLYVQMA
jgi:hypothetical protein